MPNRTEFIRVDKAAGALVADERVVIPAVPERLHYLGKFFRAAITSGVVWYRSEAETARR